MSTQEETIESSVKQEAENFYPATAGGKFLTFKLADEEFGLEILKVKEIIGLMEITKMPGTPGHIRGVINLRGKVIPVIELRTKFGMERVEDTDETCIIVSEIRMNGSPVLAGILVDAVSEVQDIESSQIENTPSLGAEVDTSYISGMGKIGKKVVILLNINKVLDADELEALQQ